MGYDVGDGCFSQNRHLNLRILEPVKQHRKTALPQKGVPALGAVHWCPLAGAAGAVLTWSALPFGLRP